MRTLSTRKISTRSNQKRPSFLLRILESGFWSLEESITKNRTKHFNPDQDIHLYHLPMPIILFLSTVRSTAWL